MNRVQRIFQAMIEFTVMMIVTGIIASIFLIVLPNPEIYLQNPGLSIIVVAIIGTIIPSTFYLLKRIGFGRKISERITLKLASQNKKAQIIQIVLLFLIMDIIITVLQYILK